VSVLKRSRATAVPPFAECLAAGEDLVNCRDYLHQGSALSPLGQCASQHCGAECCISCPASAQPTTGVSGPCPTVDLSQLSVPDAPIGDAGASLPGCNACARSTCQAQLAACNDDCLCRASVPTFVECLATGKYTFEICAAHLDWGFDAPGLALRACLGQGCAKECCTGC
jgi:hypothetical protein